MGIEAAVLASENKESKKPPTRQELWLESLDEEVRPHVIYLLQVTGKMPLPDAIRYLGEESTAQTFGCAAQIVRDLARSTQMALTIEQDRKVGYRFNWASGYDGL